MAKIADASPRATSFQRLRTSSMHATRVLFRCFPSFGANATHDWSDSQRNVQTPSPPIFLYRTAFPKNRGPPADRWSCYPLFRQVQNKVTSTPSFSAKLTDRSI